MQTSAAINMANMTLNSRLSKSERAIVVVRAAVIRMRIFVGKKRCDRPKEIRDASPKAEWHWILSFLLFDFNVFTPFPEPGTRYAAFLLDHRAGPVIIDDALELVIDAGLEKHWLLSVLGHLVKPN